MWVDQNIGTHIFINSFLWKPWICIVDAYFIALFFYVVAKRTMWSLAGMDVIVSISLILIDAWGIFVDSDIHASLSNDDSPRVKKDPPASAKKAPPARGEKAPQARAKKAPTPKVSTSGGMVDAHL